MKKRILAAFLSASIALLCACGEGKESIILDNGSSSASESSSTVSGGTTSNPTNQNESTSAVESNNSSSSALESQPAGSTSDSESSSSEPDASSSSSITSQSSSSSTSKPQSSSSSTSKPQSSSSSSGSQSNPKPDNTEEVYIVEAVDGGVYIEEYRGKAEKVVIPDTIDGKKVVGLGESSFFGNKYITSVTIPAGVKWLTWKDGADIDKVNSYYNAGLGAFANCPNLKEVKFGGSDLPNFVCDWDFRDTPWLEAKKAENPDCLVINNTLVRWWKDGGTAEIPNGVKKIGCTAFHGRKEITNVNIPNSVTEIGKYAFWMCGGLDSIIIPDSVTEIGEGAFGHCGLSNIKLSNNITCIKDKTFEWCGLLTSLNIPDRVTTIVGSPFDNMGLGYAYIYYKGQEYWGIYNFYRETQGIINYV